MKTCVNCQSQVNDEYKFCPKCGHSMETKPVCVSCGKTLEVGQVFCPFCGAKQETAPK